MSPRFEQRHFNGTNVRIKYIQRNTMRVFLETAWFIAPKTTGKLVRGLFFTPKAKQIQPREREVLRTGNNFQIPVHGKMVQCWKWGDGPGILFVHGWGGRGVRFSRFIEPVLSTGHSVIVFDAPGHGESDGQTSSYFEFTDTVRALIRPASGLDIRGIVAHSLGASAVINALSKEPKPLDAVLLAPALRLRELLHNTFNSHGIPARVYLRLIGEFEERFGYCMERDNPHRLLPEISSRLLIIHDRDDAMVPYIDSKETAEHLGNVVFHPTRGLGHKRIVKDPGIVDLTLRYLIGPEDSRTIPVAV